MIITCTFCSMRLQVDDEKVPARPFTLRCPKCQNIVHAQPPVSPQEQSAAAVDQSQPSCQTRLEASQPPAQPDKPASPAEQAGALVEGEPSNAESKELLRMLTALLQRGAQAADTSSSGSRFEWEGRRVLLCLGEAHREAVARSLGTSDYQVYVAADKTQAVERMRDEKMDVIFLSEDFDPVEQGTAFITREVSSMRPAERRRLFLVKFTDGGRTLDAHAAFINNVNLIVNPESIDKMPRALERALRDYNELYRNYNAALGVSPL